MGDAVTLRQVVHRHLEAVEHRGLLAVHHALAGDVQVVEDPVALTVRHGSLAERLVQMPAGARRIGAEPVALQAHRHVRDAHVLAGVLDAVVVVVLPYHTGDVRLGDAEQAVAVGQGAEPVQVEPLVVADERRHAGLVGLVETLATGVVVVGQVRFAGDGVGRVGADLLNLLAVLDHGIQVQQLAVLVGLVLAEDGVVALLIHLLQILLGGRGDPGEHLGHVVVAVAAVAAAIAGTGVGPGTRGAGGHDASGEGLGLAAVALARLGGVAALGLGDVDDGLVALVGVGRAGGGAAALHADMAAILHRAQAVLVLLVQAQTALIAQAVCRRGDGILVHVVAAHVLVAARLGGVGGVGAGGRGGLGAIGQTGQHDEVAGLRQSRVQVVRGRQGVVAVVAGGIFHVRRQGLGLVVEVGVDPVVVLGADVLQRGRPHVLIRVAHDFGAVGEQHLEGGGIGRGLVQAGAIGQELPVAVLVGHVEAGAGHVLVAVLIEELLVVIGHVQRLSGSQRQIRVVRAQAVLGQVVAAGQILQHILSEGPVAAPHALLVLRRLGAHEDGQVALGVGPSAVDDQLLDAGRLVAVASAAASGIVVGLSRRLAAIAGVVGIAGIVGVIGIVGILAGHDLHVAGEELGVVVVQHVQLHEVLRGRLGALGALGHGRHGRVQLADVGHHGVGRGLLLLGGHGLALVQLERVGHGHDLVVLLAGEPGVLEAAVAAGGLAGHLLPVADAGLVVPIAHESHDGALDAILFLVHEAVGVHIVPDVAVDEHRQLLGEAGVEGALVVHAVGQVVVGLQVADRVGARQDAAVQIGVVGDLLGHNGVDLVDLLVLGVDVVGQRGLEGGEVGVVAGTGAFHVEAAGHVLAGVVHHLDGVAGQVRSGRREGRVGDLKLGLARLEGGHHVGIGLDGLHLAGGQRDDLGGRELANHTDRHGALLQGHQIGGGKRRSVGVGHTVGLVHLADVLARSGRMIDLAAHEHVARQVVEVVDALGVGVGP